MTDNYVATSSTWSDYDGNDIHSDFTMIAGVPTTAAQYEPGMWNTEGGSSQYVHDDHLGTLRLTTNASGAAGSLRTFTAFGERLSVPQDRFGFVGEHCYQAHTEMPYLHVGARYYDPASGRFFQRDPIGAMGGLNVYQYGSNRPNATIDPTGLVDMVWVPPTAENDLKSPVPFKPNPHRAQVIYKEVLTVGSMYKKSDDWMHVVASCRITRECGRKTAFTFGLFKEILDIFRLNFDQRADMFANFKGMYGPSYMSCHQVGDLMYP